MLVSLSTMSPSLIADDCCCPSQCNNNRFYIGAFGGELFSESTKFAQTGTAFFTEAVGGPLAVDARGHSKKHSSGYGGVQIGYEWRNSDCCTWSLDPAIEIEAFFYRHKHRAHLINETDPNRLPEHDFLDTFHSNTGVYLVNGVLSLNACCLGDFSPYIGGGVGAANIRIKKADSLQVEPVEAGINHFNSDRKDTTWAFAAQLKAGLRYNFCERFHIFAEYRFLYVDNSWFQFGSTVYPTHAPTSTWDVEMKSTCNHAYAIGIQFDI